MGRSPSQCEGTCLLAAAPSTACEANSSIEYRLVARGPRCRAAPVHSSDQGKHSGRLEDDHAPLAVEGVSARPRCPCREQRGEGAGTGDRRILQLHGEPAARRGVLVGCEQDRPAHTGHPNSGARWHLLQRGPQDIHQVTLSPPMPLFIIDIPSYLHTYMHTRCYSFIVHLLEQGRERYGVGLTTQMCLILDRGGAVLRNGKKKQEKRDMGVIPNLVILLRHLYGTIAVRNTARPMCRAVSVSTEWG